ncbi:MAG TPA: DUF2252 domain-containing protein [Gemmatales bacterium]|nr:DUF2252 domain-containing protein [Gemmatales bacterium]
MAKKHKNHEGFPTETSPSLKTHPTRDELYAMGKNLRDKCPRQSHGVWKAPDNREDPLFMMMESNKGRMLQLLPVRHGRMMKSPFTFFRGAALNMAADLADTPATGIRVQACGDCHLMNFGSFATPERRIIFDINDLDETLPAPWEWDIKRLSASFVLACRSNGFTEDTARESVLASVRSYRDHMSNYSEMNVLDVWYDSIDAAKLLEVFEHDEARKRFKKRLAKAKMRSIIEHEFPELVTSEGIRPMIRENPPLIFHQNEKGHEEFSIIFQQAFANYRQTLQEDRRQLLDRFKVLDVAMKVVGVGSVGTYCGIILLMAGENDPLFLQVKQARSSVLEPYAGKSQHANNGQRIVHGYRMMQSASDIFLGWTEGQEGRHFYIRQLKDMKIKPMVEVFTPTVMIEYASICGWSLAHAHARSCEPAMISGYLGSSDKFDEAIADFAVLYADQSEADHTFLMNAIRAGKLEVFVEEEQ